jgi:hypothetical protein
MAGLEPPRTSSSSPVLSVPARPRTVLLGGSTSFGLGVRGRPYGVRVADALDAAELLNLTSSGPLIDEDVAALDRIAEFRPEPAIISGGVAEQIVHPSPALQRVIEGFAPATWHGVAGLEPRPYFSTSSRRRRVRQRMVSRAKTGVKRTALRMGGHQRMPLHTVREHLLAVLTGLQSMGASTVFIGAFPVDDHLFPGTAAAFERLTEMFTEVVGGAASTVLVHPDVHVWDDYLADHLHFNDAGHERVAAQILAELGRT